MPFPALHRERFKEDLANMPLDELLQLEIDTRQKRDASHVGVGTQLAAAIPSRGASLFTMAVWYGPRSGYYGYKHRIVMAAIQKRGLVGPSRPFPAAARLVNVPHGGGADRFRRPPDETEFAQPQDAEQLVLGAITWLGRLFNAAGSTIENRPLTVEHPSIAAEGDSNASNGCGPETRQLVADRLGELAGRITRGSEPLISTESAKVPGSVDAGIVLGEEAGNHVERLLPDAGMATNEARLTFKKIWAGVSVTTILWAVLIAGLMLPIIHFLLTRRSFNPPCYKTDSIDPLLPFTSHPPSQAEYGVNTTTDSPHIPFSFMSDAYTLAGPNFDPTSPLFH